MCPACLANIALNAVGASSVGGAIVLGLQKIFPKHKINRRKNGGRRHER